MKSEADFQQMIQERLKKGEEIKNCLKLSTVSHDANISVMWFVGFSLTDFLFWLKSKNVFRKSDMSLVKA